jgi:plasmid stabilization system protein ParE
MVRVVVTEIAKHDVRRILSDLNERAGYRVAAKYAFEFKAAYRRLASLPQVGPPRPALGPTTRVVIILPYLIVYEYAADVVTVLRVLHGKRNINRDLLRR